jgi:hypothetical protein
MKLKKEKQHPLIQEIGEYEECAATSRDRCFIGKSIEGNIDYEVGEVQVMASWMEQEQINFLIERFYVRLAQDSYYMEATMLEIGLTADIKVPLLEKIRLLINNTVEKTST